MQRFLKHIAFYFIPFFILFSCVIYLDIFKVFHPGKDFYKSDIVELNRSVTLYRLLKRNSKSNTYNSFILGNSRSQAYKCDEWAQYLDSTAQPFHFDGSGEGLFGITKKLAYLDTEGYDLQNVLLVIDQDLLSKTENINRQLNIMHPAISKESYLTYYKTFLKSTLNLKFILGYADLKLTDQFKPYMKDLFGDKAFTDSIKLTTGDIYYGYDKAIEEDSVAYYTNLKDAGVFSDRKILSEHLTNEVTADEIDLLQTIAAIFEKHQTNYTIIISPLFDQVPLNSNQKNTLTTIFDEQFIHDYSGVNKYTNHYGYYYESSHYRPIVANEIMKQVYSK